MSKHLVGIDISSKRISAVEVKQTGKKDPVIVRASSVELPEGAATDSEVQDITVVAQTLRDFWKLSGFGTKKVVIGVGNQRVLVRDHVLPMMSAGDLRTALPFSVADLLPVPVNETILDFYPVATIETTEGEQAQGLLVAVMKENVETLVSVAQDAGLSVANIDLSPFAAVRALALAVDLTGTKALLVVGDSVTYIIVLVDGVPGFVRILPAGSDSLTLAVGQATGLSAVEAEILKKAEGLTSAESTHRHELLRSMNHIATSMRSTIGYYQANLGSVAVDEIFVIGSETSTPGFLEYLQEETTLKVTKVVVEGGPLQAEMITDSSIDLASSGYSIALGLALEGN